MYGGNILGNMKKSFWTILPAILIIGALVGGVFIYRSQALPKIAQEQTTATLTPTPTPAPEPKREELKLQILNGRGVAGISKEAKDFLENLGYKDIQVDNADSFDYEQTTVEVKEDKQDYAALLVADLTGSYEASASATFLSEENDFDAIVTIGLK